MDGNLWTVHIQRYAEARSFLERAESWLLEREAEHNLILGLAEKLARGHHRYAGPNYFAVIADANRIHGCVLRTPPHKLLVTDMPDHGVPLLVQDASEVYQSLPAVLGPARVAEQVAAEWARGHGCAVRRGMLQGIYVLDRVRHPVAPPAGLMRPATLTDIAVTAAWAKEFLRETRVSSDDPVGLVRQFIDDRLLFIWDDAGPRGMAACAGTTPNGARLGFVFTPPEFRGRGYASAVVAQLSQTILDDGKRFCFLYTDLANQTSNGIYLRLGYVQVSEVVDVNLAAVEG